MGGQEIIAGNEGKKKAKKTLQLSNFLPSLSFSLIGDGTAVGGGRGEVVAELLQDPLVVFGAGIMDVMILSKLDARSVAQSRSVCRGWLGVASSDNIWAPKTRITRMDLCDHEWEFHFTQAAPEYWRNLDPYWRGTGALMRRHFHPDGTITADPDDEVWGGHESSYTTVTGLLADGKIREHYVRVNRWPQLYVQRKQDWGWLLSNHLYSYSSVPDADKEDGTGPFVPLF
ncbi:hypothetical protein BUALT_Bualt14G0045300 [Buddleja alternifolia]|uniref:F-box domain-containing protein n=1 Tax=Buddleja alternifolia TaxID=168488 RepID=A0AAV6WGV0_9LAMI|nr:hypothetical protein BUALT_Bualt14G0045300 [Buddleja alternifolia]